MKKIPIFLVIIFSILALASSAYADHSINVSIYPNGGGTISGNCGPFADDDVGPHSITASPNPGFTFSGWTLDGSISSWDGETVELDTDRDRNITANFSQIQHSIYASISPEGAGTVDGTGTFSYDVTTKTLAATANSGYSFSYWETENGTHYTDNPCVFDLDRDRNIKAVFEKNGFSIAVDVYPKDAGMVSGGGNFKETDNVTLTATPATGYIFINWSLNGKSVSTLETYTFKPTQSGTYVANFLKNTSTSYTVTYLHADAKETKDYADVKHHNENLTLRGTTYTKNGYVQTGWVAEDKNHYDLNGTYNLNTDITLYPTWDVAGEHTLTVYYNAACGNIKTGETLVKNGDKFKIKDDGSATFHFTAITDYYAGSVVLNGVKQEFKDDTFTVPGRNTDQTMTVTFFSRFGNPATGDNSNILLWSCLFGLSAAAVTTGMVLKKKSKS